MCFTYPASPHPSPHNNLHGLLKDSPHTTTTTTITNSRRQQDVRERHCKLGGFV